MTSRWQSSLIHWALEDDRRRIERLRLQDVSNRAVDSTFQRTSEVAHEFCTLCWLLYAEEVSEGVSQFSKYTSSPSIDVSQGAAGRPWPRACMSKGSTTVFVGISEIVQHILWEILQPRYHVAARKSEVASLTCHINILAFNEHVGELRLVGGHEGLLEIVLVGQMLLCMRLCEVIALWHTD